MKRAFLLPCILLLALAVRLPGVLGEPALGQTDAYAHLQFLRDMAEQGRLRHANYPPGFYLLAALPLRLTGLDPYHAARFGGLCFGLGLVLAAWRLMRSLDGEASARWTAFLLAGFPGLYLLHKTSLGLYPMQLGLMLLPLLLLAWWRSLAGARAAMAGFALCALALAMSTPMLLLDVLPFFAGHALWRMARGRLPRAAMIPLALAAVAMASGVALLFARGGADALRATAGILARRDYSTTPPVRVLLDCLGVYARPKRLPPGPPAIAALAWLAGAAIAGVGLGLRRRHPPLAWLAAWTFFAWAQTVFACFQFPGYFRAGWPFLIGLGLLGGAGMVHLLPHLPQFLQRACRILLLAAPLANLWLYPRHHPHLSPCESDLVRFAREQLRVPPPPDTRIWSRAWNTFPGHQGDPLHALWEGSGIPFATLKAEEAATLAFDPALAHVLILDDRPAAPLAFGVMQWVDPALVRAHRRNIDRALAVSALLRQRGEDLDPALWRVETERLPGGLELMWIQARPAAVDSGIEAPRAEE